nr:MAG TPA: Membrane-associated apoptosis protein [Caudoviricetes sp.]
MSGFVLAAVSFTANHSKAAVCYFWVTKKRRIATTLFSCSEDGAKERYSIICCTFSSCLQPLCQWLHRR